MYTHVGGFLWVCQYMLKYYPYSRACVKYWLLVSAPLGSQCRIAVGLCVDREGMETDALCSNLLAPCTPVSMLHLCSAFSLLRPHSALCTTHYTITPDHPLLSLSPTLLHSLFCSLLPPSLSLYFPSLHLHSPSPLSSLLF